MDVALKLLLLAALTLLVSAQTPTDYRDLSNTLQKHVDKALEEGNRKFGRNYHVDFHSIVKTPVLRQKDLNVNVLLEVTTCKKAHSYKHQDECNTKKEKTPLIDCLVCMMKSGNELVHCVKKIEVNNREHKEIRNNCTNHHHIGGSIIMGSSMPNINKLGCLGCNRKKN